MNIKKFFTLGLLFITIPQLFSQFNEVDVEMSRGKQKGLIIQLDSLTKDISFQAITEYLTEKDSRIVPSFSSLDEISFIQISLPLITSSKCDLYGIFNNESHSFIVCLNSENRFVNSNNAISEYQGFQMFMIEIKKKIDLIIKQNEINRLKTKIAALEKENNNVITQIKYLNKDTKSDIKSAEKDQRVAVKTNEQLKDLEKDQEAIRQSIITKEKELNEFPIDKLNAEINQSNKNIKSNRKKIKSLVKKSNKLHLANVDQIGEIKANDLLLLSNKDDSKLVKKLEKDNAKRQNKIDNNNIKIAANNASISTIQSEIMIDSIRVKKHEKSITDFDVKSRKKEISKLKNKDSKIDKKTESKQNKIDDSQSESELKRKEAEAAQLKVIELSKKQLEIQKELDETKALLKLLER
ncbi:MAG: hypothetical protein Q8K70_11795 [Bacteroidota bacterium]|nr:hypothetical protein [Bacteroidota bacterium]